MKKNKDEIVFNLEKNSSDSVRNLSKEDQKKMQRLQEQLRKELGLEIIEEPKEEKTIEKKPINTDNNLTQKAQNIVQNAKKSIEQKEQEDFIVSSKQVTQTPKQEPVKNQASLQERINKSRENFSQVVNNNLQNDSQSSAPDSYGEFLNNYSKKEESIELTNFGKYDSDLDFKLNHKIKKVKFPVPKKVKILLACLASILVLASMVIIPFVLYKEPPQVLLTKVTLSQPIDNSYYIVGNVYAGDSITYDNIYLNCEYSDGSYKKLGITNDMVSATSGNIQNGIFTAGGTAIVQLKYENFDLSIKYIIQEKQLTNIEIFGVKNIIASSLENLNLNTKLTINANYSNANSKLISLDDCVFKIAGQELSTTNGILNLPELSSGMYEVEVSYQGNIDTFKITVE